MSDSLIIKTFGGFSMTHGDKTISDQDNRSKKLWIILEYLIAFHDRHVPQSTIIDLIWNEESVSADPENALKTALHRIRAMLDELQLSEKRRSYTNRVHFHGIKPLPANSILNNL